MPNVEQYKEQLRQERAGAQAVADRVLSTGEPLEVKPWSWSNFAPAVILAVLAMAIGRFSVNADFLFGIWTATILGLLAITLGLLTVRSRSRVSLKFRRDGVDTASHGFIPWNAIEGMRSSHTGRPPIGLQFLVPRLPDLISQMKPMARFYYGMRFGQGRFRLVYPLDYSRPRAQLLAIAAEMLWEAKTGRRNTWFPDDPEFSHQLQKMQAAVPTLTQSGAPLDPATALAELEQFKKSQDQFASFMRGRKAKEQRMTGWTVGIALLCFIAYIVLKTMT
jgi:hypothetical protein